MTDTRKELKEWFRGIKSSGHPCTDCGRVYHWYVMDFDHRPGEVKRYKLSTMVNNGFSKEEILEEMEKCDFVCASCHRLRTWSRFDSVQRLSPDLPD